MVHAGKRIALFCLGLVVSFSGSLRAQTAAPASNADVQKVIGDDNLIDNVQAMGERLMTGLTERLGHRHVGDIRGRGLFQAVELVTDRATRQLSIPP